MRDKMKLYTEKQLITCYNKGLREGKNNVIDSNLLYGFLPIELPSDEEIGVIALNIADTLNHKLNSQEEAFYLAGFQTCAKWVIEQIKQQDDTRR